MIFKTSAIVILSFVAASWQNNGRHVGCHPHLVLAQEQDHGTKVIRGGHPNHGSDDIGFSSVACDPTDTVAEAASAYRYTASVADVASAPAPARDFSAAAVASASTLAAATPFNLDLFLGVDPFSDVKDDSDGADVVAGAGDEGVGSSNKGATRGGGMDIDLVDGGRFVPVDLSSSVAAGDGKVLKPSTVSSIDDIVDPLSIFPDKAMFVETDSDRLLKNINARKVAKYVKGGKKGKSKKEVDLPNSSDSFVEEDYPADFVIFQGRSSEDEDRQLFDSAKDAIDEFIASLNLGFGSTFDSLYTLSQIAEAASFFIPKMAIIAGIFGKFAELTDPFQDEVMAKLSEIYDELKNIGKKIDDLIGDITKLNCLLSFDMRLLQDNQLLRSVYDNFVVARSEMAKEREFENLKNACEDPSNRPAIAFTSLEDIVFDRGFFFKCHQEIVKSTNDGILAYQRVFVLPLTQYILKTMEYEGICEGTKNTIRPRTIEGITKRIEAMEDNMAIKKQRMANGWVESFQNTNNDKKEITTDSVLNDLQTNYSPGFRYRVFQIDQVHKFYGGDNFFSRFGPSSLFARGSFHLKVKKNGLDRWIVVMWMAPNFKPRGQLFWRRSRKSFCGYGEPMCYRQFTGEYCCSEIIGICLKKCPQQQCRYSGCGSGGSEEVITGLIANNLSLYNELFRRNAYFVTTRSIREVCPAVFPPQPCYTVNPNSNEISGMIGSAEIRKLVIREGNFGKGNNVQPPITNFFTIIYLA